MNAIRKNRESGTINIIRKKILGKTHKRKLEFDVGKIPRNIMSKLLFICGRVGAEDASKYREKADELNADFILANGSSWIFAHQAACENYEDGKHEGVLLIGNNKQLPATPIAFQGSFGFSDWFIQDVNGDGMPDVPVGRIFGSPETILYHMDPMIIDSNIAVVFDSQPGRSKRHVEALAKLGFDVEVLTRYTQMDQKLLSVSEFILQFSDGVFTSRIHGTPEKWASHNSVILSYEQAASIEFKGYPVVYSEACSTALEGPLLKAFLDQGACYIGATLDTVNNLEPFEDWRSCPYADGWKFGFLDLLDTYNNIGQVKLHVDREIFKNLDNQLTKEIEGIRKGQTTKLSSEKALSVVEWILFGNPLRRTTVGPNADYTPGRLIVDT